MSEPERNYELISYKNIRYVQPEYEILAKGFNRLRTFRPFGFQHFNNRRVVPVMQFMSENGKTTHRIEVDELPGLYPFYTYNDEPLPENKIGFRFLYYKAKDQKQEQFHRDIVVDMYKPNIGFGVYPDPGHKGERPGWYLIGDHVGFSKLDTGSGNLVTIEKIPDPTSKHFALHRVVVFFSDPATDKSHRDFWNIAEITA
jgi:hypothetical protein